MYIENNKLGCNVFQKPLVPVTLPVFLLVDRGDCYFVEKVCIAFPSVCLLRRTAQQPDTCKLNMRHPHSWLTILQFAALCASPFPNRHCALLCCYIEPYTVRIAVLSCGSPSPFYYKLGMVLAQAYNAEKAGAKAIIVADYKDERLLTMAVPEDRPEIAALKNDITIPTALITQVCHDTHCRWSEYTSASHTERDAAQQIIWLSGEAGLLRSVMHHGDTLSWSWTAQEVGQKIKDALHARNAAPVIVELDWKESVLHEDDR